MELIALYNDSMRNWKKYELPKAQSDRIGQQLMLNIKGMEFFKDKVGA